jgi:hypothetical protein
MKRQQARTERGTRSTGGRNAPQIKVTRNSRRPQIKASRGPGGPTKQRRVSPSRRPVQPRPVSETDRRVAETRRQSLSSLGATQGSGGVRAVASGGGAAASAVRVVQEVARPVGAITRPVLRLVGGGIEAIPQAAGRATPATRGRLLIMLVGALAAGLIYINVGRLEAGDGFAKYQERSLELQRENTALRSRITNLRAADRIKSYARMQGLVMPAPQQFSYLKSRRGDALKAAENYSAPVSSARPLPPGASAAVGAGPTAPVASAGSAPGAENGL